MNPELCEPLSQEPEGLLHNLPKWRAGRKKQRLTTANLIRMFRSEVWSHALLQRETNHEDFLPVSSADTKPSEVQLPLTAALL